MSVVVWATSSRGPRTALRFIVGCATVQIQQVPSETRELVCQDVERKDVTPDFADSRTLENSLVGLCLLFL